MTGAPASSTARLPEHPDCPVCFKRYDSTKRIPTASGIPGCSHNGCAPCVQKLAVKIADMNMKRCVQGCTLSQNDLSKLSLASVTPVPNTDLTKAIVVVEELSAIITAQNVTITALQSNAPMGAKEFLEMQAFLVSQIEELNKQFALSQERVKELEQANTLLDSELKGRVSAEPQPPCSSTDLGERITRLIEQPVITCSSSDRSTSKPAASSAVPYTLAQMNTLFPPSEKNYAKMAAMDPAVLHATIQAEGFSSAVQFDLLSEAQWENLPLSTMPAAQIKLMFFKNNVGLFWERHYSDRMKMIPPPEVHEAIRKGKITDIHIFSYIPVAYLKRLRLSQLDSDVICNLLLANGEFNVSNKLKSICPNVVNDLIVAKKIDHPEILKNIPDEYLRGLPFSEMSSVQIQMMFPAHADGYWKQLYCFRMKQIHPDELSAAFRADKLNGYLVEYLPSTILP